MHQNHLLTVSENPVKAYCDVNPESIRLIPFKQVCLKLSEKKEVRPCTGINTEGTQSGQLEACGGAGLSKRQLACAA